VVGLVVLPLLLLLFVVAFSHQLKILQYRSHILLSKEIPVVSILAARSCGFKPKLPAS